MLSSDIPMRTLLLLLVSLGCAKQCLAASFAVDSRCLIFIFIILPSSVRVIRFPAWSPQCVCSSYQTVLPVDIQHTQSACRFFLPDR